MSSHPKAIIIGAGIAGLATAIRLTLQGFEVTVYEKNSYAGGKMGKLILGEYQFDTGPSLLMQPQKIEDLFREANEPIENYLSYQKLPSSCKYFYEDGTVINAYTNATALAEELQTAVGEEPSRVERYLNQSEKIYNKIGRVFLENSLHKRSSFVKLAMVRALTATRFKYLFNSLNRLNKKHFSKPQTVQLFNRFATYNGSNPYKAPGMLSVIPHLELNEGVYYPEGGMITIAEALFKLAIKKGVQFKFNASVSRIIRNEGKVLGIVANNQNQFAEVVVSNIDVTTTYKKLLHDPLKTSKLSRQPRSSSAIIFYWGINTSFPQLQLHNVFFSADYKQEFQRIFGSNTCSRDPTIYINITSKLNSYHAPANCENWFVMINAPVNRGQDWSTVVQQCRQNVIKKLNRILETNIESFIEVEEVADPVKLEEHTGAFMGAIYGTSSNSALAAFRRHPNFSRDLTGLYFVGGTVHPGGGIPLCFNSAKITANLIQSDLKKFKAH